MYIGRMHTITAVVNEGRIYVKSPFALKDVAKSIAGASWDKNRKAWHYPASPVAAANIRKAYDTCVPSVDHIDVDLPMLKLLAESEGAAEHIKVKHRDDLPNTPTKTEAWLHQRQAYEFFKNRSGVLWMGMGTGKTLDYVALCDGNEYDVAVIVTTRKGRRVFPKQFRLHSNREWIVCNGVTKRDGTLRKSAPLPEYVATMQRALAHGKATGQPVALVVNYDVIWREPMHDFLKGVLSSNRSPLIYDESHRIKAPGSRVSKAAAGFQKYADKVWQGSGTWLAQGKIDAYAQARAIDPSYFGTSFARFRNKFCIMGGFENRQIIGYKNEDEFNAILAQFVYTAETDDVLDLPPVQHFVRPIDVGEKARKVIRQLEADFEAGIEEGTITTANALTRLLRQQQATSGLAVIDPDDTSDEPQVVVIDDAKKTDLADILEDLPVHEKVVVVCRFVHDLESVREVVEASGRTYGEVSGRREDTSDDATFPDHIDVMGVQIQSGSEAIDLTAARHCVMFSVGYSLKDYEQVLRRVHRPGQTRETFYHHLIATHTVDEKVYAALAQKKAVVQSVIDYTKGAHDFDADALEKVLNDSGE